MEGSAGRFQHGGVAQCLEISLARLHNHNRIVLIWNRGTVAQRG